MRTQHDRFFHYVFSKPEHAAGELRAVLGSDLGRRIDWATLTPLPARFVDPKLAELRSDVLFSAKLDGRDVLLYLLLEHQSTPDRWMALRLLGYVVEIWERHRAEHSESDRVPAVLPMVVYHGERPWPERRALHDLVDLDRELLQVVTPHVPDFEFFLDDISCAKDDELRSRAMMTALGQLALLCLARPKTRQNFIVIPGRKPRPSGRGGSPSALFLNVTFDGL